jgi:branched-chain amino acid aminotransferase
MLLRLRKRRRPCFSLSSAAAALPRVKWRGLSAAASTDPTVYERYAYRTPALHKVRREDLESQWDSLGFSIRNMNGHVRFTWSNGSWDAGVFVPAPYQLLHINSGALHYGVSAFEGMKAFESKEGTIRLVKPELNAARMQRGAAALLMPAVPQELFVSAVKEAVRRNREFVPPYGHGASMYIRPLLFASGPMLGLAPLASEFTFMVCVMPTGGYFQNKQLPSDEAEKGAAVDAGQQLEELEPGVTALVSEAHDRAAPRGTGCVKAAGNYAADLYPVHAAQRGGYSTTLYLDATQQRYVEEFSVANFVGITKAGVFVTPRSPTILASTTNILLMEIARSHGIPVEQRPVDFDAVLTFPSSTVGPY